MTNIDQFESVFRAAVKADYRYRAIPITSVLVVTDLTPEAGQQFGADVRRFLSSLGEDVEWDTALGTAFNDVGELLKLVETRRPDLVVTYRHLHSDAWKWPFSLGVYLDVLTQATTTPVLVVPHPDRAGEVIQKLNRTESVVAMTDHLTADDALVNWAARFTSAGGTLHLTHVEDQATLERYVNIISKVPEIDTETATREIRAQLLKEPHDYVSRCRRALSASGLDIQVAEHIAVGHHLDEHRRLVEEQRADLLVMNTKDDDQLAMHGLAHALAVELRDIPVLML